MNILAALLLILGIYGSVLAQKPNLVFILADDCTHWDLGCYGSANAITPHIDRLAREGMKFERCYQAAPMCSPTRHNIFTGLYPVKTGAYPNHTFVKEGTRSMVQYLRPLGYRVALSGKRHINPESIFDFEYLGETNNPQFDLVEAFLKEVKVSQESFALVLTSNEPHMPWNKGNMNLFNPDSLTLPPFFADTRETREAYVKYLAEINYLDNQVGTAIELLDTYGFSENTLVIFASEQGAQWPFAKWTLYEAGVKSGLIAKMPGMIHENSTFEGIVEYSDILPTFIEMAGGKVPVELDGKSLVPILKQQLSSGKEYAYSLQTTRGIYFGSEQYGIRSVVNNQYRYIWNLTPDEPFLNIVNNHENSPPAWYASWQEAAVEDERVAGLLYRYKYRPEEELYQVINDQWCFNNLADNPEYDGIKKELRKELLSWMSSCGDDGKETEMEAMAHVWNN